MSQKFFLYARKSTDRSDNQIESLPDQIRVLKRLANERGLKIVDIIQESKSAKKPYNRPLFTEMISRIQKGEGNSILCWKLDRLSRNPIDAGTISWMLQEGVISQIVTSDKTYSPEDNVLMMSIEMGMATQYVKDLSSNVSRSVLSKFERGEFPSRAPLGYLNVRENKKKAYVGKDSERFELTRKMWDLMLTGAYSPKKIAEIADKEWGLKTRPRGKFSPKGLNYPIVYKIFTNEFYAGYLNYRGTQYKAAHEPMVTLEEFDRVQKLLGLRGKPRARSNEFSFTGAITCEICGGRITAEKKVKLIKSTNNEKEFVYVHCSHRKKNFKCNDKTRITEKELEDQIINKISETQMPQEFYEFAIDKLKRANKDEFAEKEQITSSLQKQILQCDEKLERLLDAKIEGLIDSEKYIKKKEEINNEKALATEKLDSAENKIGDWVETAEKAVDFVTFAKTNYINGSTQEKKEILLTLGQDLTMKNGILSVGDRSWREPFAQLAKYCQQKNAGDEPTFSHSQTNESGISEDLKSLWWTRSGLN